MTIKQLVELKESLYEYFDEEGNIREEHNYDQNGNVESNSNPVQSFDEKGHLIK